MDQDQMENLKDPFQEQQGSELKRLFVSMLMRLLFTIVINLNIFYI